MKENNFNKYSKTWLFTSTVFILTGAFCIAAVIILFDINSILIVLSIILLLWFGIIILIFGIYGIYAYLKSKSFSV